MGLQTYRERRRFDVTAEPRGGRKPRAPHERIFVVQKHDASRLHYDFRLELDGVLKSWAVPKGPSTDPGERRLAVEVEDHPIEYATFEGTIPRGQYGAGTVEIWDSGTWEPEGDARTGLHGGSLHFVLHGRRLKGRWNLVRMNAARGGRSDKPQWLLIKSRDDTLRDTPATRAMTRGRATSRHGAKQQGEPLPRFIVPQLATAVEAVPTDDGWLHEIKFDGYRIQARIDHGEVALRTRTAQDWTDRYPEVADALKQLDVTTAIIDGEIAVVGPDGVTHFQLLQNAGGSDHPLTYFVFDLLHRDGRDLTGLPLEERKGELAELLPKLPKKAKAGDVVRLSEHVIGRGEEFHRLACERGLEGIISKVRDGRYLPGRTREWLKGKCRPRQEFVIGGFTEPRGSRQSLGSLLLGTRKDGGALEYVGKVGTGFDVATLRSLRARLGKLEQDEPPFAKAPRMKDVHWVSPALVAEVSFAMWTRDGLLRQPSFLGLRDDKPAEMVRVEKPERATSTPRRGARPRAAAAPMAPAATPAAPSARSSRARAASGEVVAGVTITHPDRVIWKPEGITKVELARYLERASDWMLPHVADRPLMILRCPNGVGSQCFVQKHPGSQGGWATPGRAKASSVEEMMVVQDAADLVRLVQNGAVEIHTWGATTQSIERPDRLVFDLDPHESLSWARVVDTARALRTLLAKWKLPAFVKTTGGKGVHVLVPLKPVHDWDQLRGAADTIAKTLQAQHPDELTLFMAKSKRIGKIFVDTLRNVRGATFVAPYSPRARAGATISLPITWEQLTPRATPERHTIRTFEPPSRRADPWRDWEAKRVRLPAELTRGAARRR